MNGATELGQTDTFTATIERDDDVVTVRLKGDANMSAVGPIGKALIDAHGLAIGIPTSLVLIDFRRLEFMSSACFKKFVGWLDAAQGAPPATQYRVRFLSNPQYHWQRRSLHALQCFALDLVTIES
jgi:hypothetical protein